MISIIILIKNEEKNLIDCLETVFWADEIIIVDDNSEDRSLEIVRNLNNKKIKIYKRKLNSNFSEQRNFALSKSTKQWVLFIDADERITPELKNEINSIIVQKDDEYDGYLIKRKDIMWGKTLNYGEMGNVSFLRLGKRGAGAWVGDVHEIWQIDGKIGILENYILHYPHQTVGNFLYEINSYSTIRAKELYNKHIKVKAQDIFLYPMGKFLLNYIIQLGFLDGIAGMIVALMMSMHSFLVRGKLWQLWQKN